MSKVVFLDRDGTINVEKKYLYRKEEFEFLPGVIEALKMLQDAGYLLIVITNQSGIARGYYTEEDFEQLNIWMLERLKENGIRIAKVYYCPHLPDAKIKKYRKKCVCRKPEIGLYEKAVAEFKIDLSKSFVVGDKLRDCSICEISECKGFLIYRNETLDNIDKVQSQKIRNVIKKENLLECAKMIISY